MAVNHRSRIQPTPHRRRASETDSQRGSYHDESYPHHLDRIHLFSIAHPITKWNWVAQSADKIPEVTRRAFKFASTMPSGPVFLAYPEDILDDEQGEARRDRPDLDAIDEHVGVEELVPGLRE